MGDYKLAKISPNKTFGFIRKQDSVRGYILTSDERLICIQPRDYWTLIALDEILNRLIDKYTREETKNED
jgi:hypothetical protein